MQSSKSSTLSNTSKQINHKPQTNDSQANKSTLSNPPGNTNAGDIYSSSNSTYHQIDNPAQIAHYNKHQHIKNMNTQTITGTYGSNETETEIYVYTDSNGLNWYACEDSVNVNVTYEELEDGVNVELVEDCDTSTSQEPICSEDDLERHMSDDEEEGLGFEYVIESWCNGQKKQAIEHIDTCGGLYDFMEWAESSQDEEDQGRVFAIIKRYALHRGI